MFTFPRPKPRDCGCSDMQRLILRSSHRLLESSHRQEQVLEQLLYLALKEDERKTRAQAVAELITTASTAHTKSHRA